MASLDKHWMSYSKDYAVFKLNINLIFSDPAFRELLPAKQGCKMAFIARQLIIFGLVVTAFCLVRYCIKLHFSSFLEIEETRLELL